MAWTPAAAVAAVIEVKRLKSHMNATSGCLEDSKGPSPGVLLLPRSPSQPSPDAAIVRRRPSGIVGEATAADCRRERKKNQTILTQTITLRPSLHNRRRRCSVAVPSSSPRSPATCPPSPLKKEIVTWATALHPIPTTFVVVLHSTWLEGNREEYFKTRNHLHVTVGLMRSIVAGGPSSSFFCSVEEVVINGVAKEIGKATIVAVTKARGMEVASAVDSVLVGQVAGRVLL
ncbi:hypothetical protein MRB53_032113 [Persea americana]|uniref:Uncharacterized protein n=1 Tax=Persea americana TaxID=3435 RepID=A0ACC2KQW4_PERAE|nr:hypothetical protein MRB53_032113 [Persea americana]